MTSTMNNIGNYSGGFLWMMFDFSQKAESGGSPSPFHMRVGFLYVKPYIVFAAGMVSGELEKDGEAAVQKLLDLVDKTAGTVKILKK